MLTNTTRSKRYWAGKRSVRDGDQFEVLVTSYAHKAGMAVEHLPKSGARFVKKGVYRPLPMPWDILLGYGKRIALIDAKTINSNTYPNSLITKHQIVAMKKFWDIGHGAGYIISFEKLDKVHFFDLETILNLQRGESLNEMNTTALLGTRWNMDLTRIFSFYAHKELDQPTTQQHQIKMA